MTSTRLQPLAKNWWMIAARGVLAVLFGTLIAFGHLSRPDATIVPFAVYAIVDGGVAIVSALRTARPRMIGWPIVVEGIVSVVLGTLMFPSAAVAETALVLLAAWGLLTGFFELVAAACVPWEADAHWFLVGGGASSVLLAMVVFAMPNASSERVALILGIYAIVFGLTMLGAAVGFRWASQLQRLAS